MKTVIRKFAKSARPYCAKMIIYAELACLGAAILPGLAIGHSGCGAAGLAAAYLAYTKFGSILVAGAAYAAVTVVLARYVNRIMLAWFFVFTPKWFYWRAVHKVEFGY